MLVACVYILLWHLRKGYSFDPDLRSTDDAMQDLIKMWHYFFTMIIEGLCLYTVRYASLVKKKRWYIQQFESNKSLILILKDFFIFSLVLCSR